VHVPVTWAGTGTMAFTTFVLFHFVNAVNARLEHTTVFDHHTCATASCGPPSAASSPCRSSPSTSP
jgi:hypothetical protein